MYGNVPVPNKLHGESYRYLDGKEERFARYAVKDTGTLRAVRRDSASTQ
jgi:hypothetical protein